MREPPPTGEFLVLAVDTPLMRQPRLFEATLARIRESAARGAVIVVCTTPHVLRATLAREPRLAGIPVVEGSQRTAIEIASAIPEARAILYTASPGVMSGDPAQVAGAAPVQYASHLEVMELAEQRASPVSEDAAREASEHNVSYEVRDVTHDRGTVVRGDGYADRLSPITSVTHASGYALISMTAKGIDAQAWRALVMQLLERVAAADISMELMQSTVQSMRCLVPADRLEFMRDLAQERGLAFNAVERCTKLCIVGSGVSSTAGIFYRSLAALDKQQVPVLHWSDSNVTLSFVVQDGYAKRASSALHDTLAPGSDVSVRSAISFDADLGVVRIDGREKRLGGRQAQLLRYLLDNVGRIVEVEELAWALFGADGKEEIAAVRVHLHNLRKKIEERPDTPRHIVTVPEQGYVFVR